MSMNSRSDVRGLMSEVSWPVSLVGLGGLVVFRIHTTSDIGHRTSDIGPIADIGHRTSDIGRLS